MKKIFVKKIILCYYDYYVSPVSTKETEILLLLPAVREAKQRQLSNEENRINMRGGPMEDFKDLKETMIKSEEIFSGKVVHLFKDTVELLNGKRTTRETVRHVGAVAIVPVTDDGEVIIELQYRYPVNQVVKEIPAGKLDSKAEDPLAAAKRELEEETGYTADVWTEMGMYYPTPAYSDEVITIYLAKGLHKGVRNLDENEFLNVRKERLSDLVRDVMQGKIMDGKTQVGLLKAYCLEQSLSSH